MNKMTGLESMRAAREQRERAILDPVVRPLRQQISSQSAQIEDLQSDVDTMSTIMTSEIGPHIIPQIHRMISERVESEIYKAMAQASSRALDEVITVPLSASMVHFARPDEVSAQILDMAAATYRTGCRAIGIVDRAASITYLRVVVPQVTAQVAMTNLRPAKRRRA